MNDSENAGNRLIRDTGWALLFAAIAYVVTAAPYWFGFAWEPDPNQPRFMAMPGEGWTVGGYLALIVGMPFVTAMLSRIRWWVVAIGYMLWLPLAAVIGFIARGEVLRAIKEPGTLYYLAIFSLLLLVITSMSAGTGRLIRRFWDRYRRTRLS